MRSFSRTIVLLVVILVTSMLPISVGAETIQVGRRFLQASQAVFSPDGTRVAYVRDGVTRDIYVVDVATGVSSHVVASEADEVTPVWRGNDILTYTVVGDDRTWEVYLPTGSIGLSDKNRLTLSPDGARTAYFEGGYIWVHEDGVDSDLHVRGSQKAYPQHAPFTWSPDSSKLVFHGIEKVGSISLPALFVSDLDGVNARRLYPFTTEAEGPKSFVLDVEWAPGSDLVAMSISRLGEKYSGILIVDAVGNLVMELPVVGRTVAWSSSGMIAVASPEGIAVMYPGGTYQVISRGTEVGSWSPDGRYLVFTRDDRRASGVWIYDADTGEVWKLV